MGNYFNFLKIPENPGKNGELGGWGRWGEEPLHIFTLLYIARLGETMT